MPHPASLPASYLHAPFTFPDFDLNVNCCQRIRHTFAYCSGQWASGQHGPSPESVLANTCVNNAIYIPFPLALDLLLHRLLAVQCPCLACCLIELCILYST